MAARQGQLFVPSLSHPAFAVQLSLQGKQVMFIFSLMNVLVSCLSTSLINNFFLLGVLKVYCCHFCLRLLRGKGQRDACKKKN